MTKQTGVRKDLVAVAHKKDAITAKGGCKGVDYNEFVEALRWALLPEHINPKKMKPYVEIMKEAASRVGLSNTTFELRANQFISPDIYGELPKGFFRGGRDKQKVE